MGFFDTAAAIEDSNIGIGQTELFRHPRRGGSGRPLREGRRIAEVDKGTKTSHNNPSGCNLIGGYYVIPGKILKNNDKSENHGGFRKGRFA
jgi:hypothetical protein